MPQYQSPGVYVEEVPSAVKAIAGVGTSTAGFIGTVPDEIVTEERVGVGDGTTKVFKLSGKPLDNTKVTAKINGADQQAASFTMATKDGAPQIEFTTAPAKDAAITVKYPYYKLPDVAGTVKLCTNFTEFKKFFGDFSTDTNQSNLAHA